MLEKLKKLDFISLKECDNPDKIDIIYIENDGRVFSKTISCAMFEIDNIKLLLEAIEQLFIERIYFLIKEPIFIEKTNLIETIDKYFNILKLINNKFNNTNKFIMISDKLKDKIEYNAKFVISKYLDEDEIIFGYKTRIDQPGIVLATNEDGIKDKSKIRLAVFDIGFFPKNAYYRLKIK